MKFLHPFYIVLISGLFFNASAQYGSTGSWRVHLPFQNARSLTTDGEKVYVGGPSGIFTLNIIDNSLEVWDKTRGLASQAVSVVKYNPEKKTLVVVYENGDIDLIKNGFITNLPAIKRFQTVGEKRIDHIYFNGPKAYLSGTLGIVEVDLDKSEVSGGPYNQIGPGGKKITVNACTIYNDTLYAASNEGIFKASINSPNLAFFAYWTVFKPSNSSRIIGTYKDKLYAEIDSVIWVYTSTGAQPFRDTIKRACLDFQENFGNLIISQQDRVNILWDDKPNDVAYIDLNYGIKAITGSNRQVFYLSFYNTGLNLIPPFVGGLVTDLYPNGPGAITGNDIAICGSDIWVAGGNPDGWYLDYNFNLLYKYSSGQWKSCVTSKCGFDSASDAAAIAYNPVTNKMYLGSFARGLYEFDPEISSIKAYNENNSSLGRPPLDPNKPLNISGIKADDAGNLWVCNWGSPSPLSVYTVDGQWFSYNFGSALSSPYPVTDIEIDNGGQKWIVASRNQGLLVFDDNETPALKTDDRYRMLKKGSGAGGLPNNDILCVTKDRDGEIWIGTQAGLTVFYNPEDVLDGADASQIIIGKGTNAAYLLGTEYINCIAVDGGNRKWIGTTNGVWLVAPDGSKVIQNFTEDNSPLFSNNVLKIAINPTTGEVMMLTEKGLISYFGDATEAADKHGDVQVYPNPVRPGYTGVVSIRGLPEKANVKITDITGMLVYETSSNGGMATWNGRNFNGQKAATGVYLVFSSNKNGEETMVSKILFVN